MEVSRMQSCKTAFARIVFGGVLSLIATAGLANVVVDDTVVTVDITVPAGEELEIRGNGLVAGSAVTLEPGARVHFSRTATVAADVTVADGAARSVTLSADAQVTGTFAGAFSACTASNVICDVSGAGTNVFAGSATFASNAVLRLSGGHLVVRGSEAASAVLSSTRTVLCRAGTLTVERARVSNGNGNTIQMDAADQSGDVTVTFGEGSHWSLGNNNRPNVEGRNGFVSRLILDGGTFETPTPDAFRICADGKGIGYFEFRSGLFASERTITTGGGDSHVIWSGGTFTGYCGYNKGFRPGALVTGPIREFALCGDCTLDLRYFLNAAVTNVVHPDARMWAAKGARLRIVSDDTAVGRCARVVMRNFAGDGLALELVSSACNGAPTVEFADVAASENASVGWHEGFSSVFVRSIAFEGGATYVADDEGLLCAREDDPATLAVYVPAGETRRLSSAAARLLSTNGVARLVKTGPGCLVVRDACPIDGFEGAVMIKEGVYRSLLSQPGACTARQTLGADVTVAAGAQWETVTTAGLAFGGTVGSATNAVAFRPLDGASILVNGLTNHWLEAVADGDGRIVGAASGWYPDGTSVDLTAEPEAGALFKFWDIRAAGSECAGNSARVRISQPAHVHAVFAPDADARLDYSCTFVPSSSQTSFSLTPGPNATLEDILQDDSRSSYAFWHVRYESVTELVLDLHELSEVSRIELRMYKRNDWYIMKELRLSLDDGSGDFSDPVVLAGLPRSATSAGKWDESCSNHVFRVDNPGKAVRVRISFLTDGYAMLQDVVVTGRHLNRRLPYDCELSRNAPLNPAGKTSLSEVLQDGDDKTFVQWHTAFKSTTDLICELPELCQITQIAFHTYKGHDWFITDELRFSLDDGSGDFSDPVILAGLPRSATSAGKWDESCSNYVFRVDNPGKAVRIKVTMVTDAYARIWDLDIEGYPFHADMPAEAPLADENPSKWVAQDNANWHFETSPLGGRVMRLYSKACGFEITDPDSRGAFTEEVWDRPQTAGFLEGKPFALERRQDGDGGREVTASGNFSGGAINFLKVDKRYVATEDSTAFDIVHRFENIPEAMALQNYAFLVRAALGVKDSPVTTYCPTERGIVAAAPGRRGADAWVHRPSRGWFAAAASDGRGVAYTFPFSEVRSLAMKFTPVPTLELRLASVGLDCGASYTLATEALPFRGLPCVSGAGGGFVGALTNGVCTLVASRADEVSVNGVPMSFAMGERRSFETDATTVVVSRGGTTLCTLEAPPSDGSAWVLEPECERRGATDVSAIDMTRYTNFVNSGGRPWAKPLPGRRLNVAFLTGYGNQVEVGRLAERFDMNFRTLPLLITETTKDNATCYELASPNFSDGDGFSVVGVSDVERGIREILAEKPDVIVIGGVRWEVFKSDIQQTIVAQVKAGAGLVCIGQDRDIPSLGFALRSGVGYATRVPDKVAGSPFDSVPFSLLGACSVYAASPPADAVRHAMATDRPFLYETPLGEGRVFNLTYCACGEMAPSLTPNALVDFYETGVAPVEYHYSLLAKTILAAAGRTLPVRLVSADVTASSATLTLNSALEGDARFEWHVADPYGRTVVAGVSEAPLAEGASTVALDGLNVPPTQGPLALHVSVRVGGTVVDWGDWAFAVEPPVVLDALSVDGVWKREGEAVTFAARASGLSAAHVLRVGLVDSYGRTLDERDYPLSASSAVSDAFAIANALPARRYLVDARVCEADTGRIVSRRRAEFWCRPEPSRYAWDDFEVGTWAAAVNRRYLWPGLADVYADIGISTVIANQSSMANTFAMRYNIHPTLLSDAGVTRTGVPDAYVKSGDKMDLVRSTCLSSREFIDKTRRWFSSDSNVVARCGLRFVWFGDELSLTSYGGGAIDFCFSPSCLHEFSHFLQDKYGTLAQANAAWQTNYTDWASFVPFTREEVWASGTNLAHVAGWADHLEFMDGRMTNAVACMTRQFATVDPDVRYAFSGTQAPSAYGGTDWWKNLGVMDAALSYTGGGQLDVHRSFRPDGGFMPWLWGYAYKGAPAVNYVWMAPFYGCRGLMGFQSKSQINSDWSHSTGLADTMPSIRRLCEGTGMHFVQNLRADAEVAVLYSQASLRAAFIEQRRTPHDNLESKVRDLLRNLGYGYDYVSYEQLEAGEVLRRGYRALVLADAVAMSDAEVLAVRAFADAGGAVISFGEPAVREQNCRSRGGSPLLDLFGEGTPHTLVSAEETAYSTAVQFPNSGDNAALIAHERTAMADALAKAGITPVGLRIEETDGRGEIVNLEILPKRDPSGRRTWCVLAPYRSTARTALFTFEEAGYVYDLVSGRAYGRTGALELTLGQGMPCALAKFPEAVDVVSVAAAGDTVSLAYGTPVDGVVRVRVFRPDGTEAACYARNVVLRKGRGTYAIPFAKFDPKGAWRIRVTSVFGNASAETTLDRSQADDPVSRPTLFHISRLLRP